MKEEKRFLSVSSKKSEKDESRPVVKIKSQQQQLKTLKGKIEWEGNLDKMRAH